ncbi:hypothetical protein LXL04_012943 [Taraxacum kok-saghyz]
MVLTDCNSPVRITVSSSGGFSERWGNQAVERWKTRLRRQWRWCRESSVLQSSLSTSPAPFNRRFHRPQSQSISDFKIRTNQVTNTQSSLAIPQSQSIDDSIRNQWVIPIETKQFPIPQSQSIGDSSRNQVTNGKSLILYPVATKYSDLGL